MASKQEILEALSQTGTDLADLITANAGQISSTDADEILTAVQNLDQTIKNALTP